MVKRTNPKKAKGSTPTKKKEGPTPPATSRLAKIFSAFVAFLILLVAIGVEHQRRQQVEEDVSVLPKNSTKAPLPRIPDNPERWNKPDRNIAFFLSHACKIAYCHPDLRAVKRSFRATREIPPGETLFEVPRSMQIWDLDALRDPFIRDHLFEAVHPQSGNVPGSEAYLAAYLALLLDKRQDNMEIASMAYLDILPKLPVRPPDGRQPNRTVLRDHPILLDANRIKGLLGRSQSLTTLQAYRNMVISEYEAFTNASPEFAEKITQKYYFEARLIVLTRAINVGPPDPADVLHDFNVFDANENKKADEWLQDELEAYRDLLDIDLKKNGCMALVPLADLFNHHPNNNVDWEYQQHHEDSIELPLKKGTFVVRSANRPIEQYNEPMASYGTLSDAHLYSRYGFINGDGSGHTQISLAYHHDILKLNMSSQYDYLPRYGLTTQFRQMLEEPMTRYIRFDDGYERCVPPPPHKWAELKKLKWQHLMKIANDMPRWTVWIPPRMPDSVPAVDITKPIYMYPPQYMNSSIVENNEVLEPIRQTCRLMSLINSDYDGKAEEVLRANLENETFVVEKGNDALEFRSLLCMARWTGTGKVAMEQTGKIQDEFERIKLLNRRDFASLEYHAYHLRFAEMQALQAITGLIFTKVTERWNNKKKNPPVEYIMRDHQCPESTIEYIYKKPDSEYSEV